MMAQSLETILSVHNLRISFRTGTGKVQAVRGISFDLNRGETLAIVGESGSGKSVTSKAILGIQAGNAIYEGGEILYDGMDLLKIGEDDFYRLRGDRIAMIFQDPLSSLNPIMRIGKQLTEAMLLKSRARRKASRKSFSRRLSLLTEAMIQAQPENAADIRARTEAFKRLETRAVSQEKIYNDALDCARETLAECENILFLISKNAWKDMTDARKVQDFAPRTIHPFVVPPEKSESLRLETARLRSDLAAERRGSGFPNTVRHLEVIRDAMQEAVSREKPDFLNLAWVEDDQEADLETGLMAAFRADAQRGIASMDAVYQQRREAALALLEKALGALEQGGVDALRGQAEALCRAVERSVDPIDVVRDSMAMTFPGSLRGFLRRYDEGLRTNARKERRYRREVLVSERRAARGKDWTVPAPTVIDLEQVKENIDALITRLASHYRLRIANDPQRNLAARADEIIAAIERDASASVSRLTRWSARNRALKLMEEVGIPEPRKRYRQYPFEFSGGMRQRIVIAIALAADPDILICDEPTTALDVTIQAQILELINRLKERRHLSILFITHDLGVVANMADRIAVMYAGKIVEYGTAEEVFYDPAHPYTWALLSSMPDLDTRDKLEAIPGTPPNMIYPPKGDAFAERNRYATQIDFELEPPAFPITDTHWAATWLLHPDAPAVDKPRAVTARIEKMRARLEAESHG